MTDIPAQATTPPAADPALAAAIFTSTVRRAGPNQVAQQLPIFQYGAIFKFNAVANTPLQAGQVTARGVVYLDSNLNPSETRTFAITGGTGAYTTARGKIAEQPIAPPVPVSAEKWLLDVP